MKIHKNLDFYCMLERTQDNINVSFSLACNFDELIVGLKNGKKHRTELVKELMPIVKKAYKKEKLTLKTSTIKKDFEIFQGLESEGTIKPPYFQDEINVINVYTDACEGIVNANIYQEVIFFTYKDTGFMLYLHYLFEIDIDDLLDTFFFSHDLGFSLTREQSDKFLKNVVYSENGIAYLGKCDSTELFEKLVNSSIYNEIEQLQTISMLLDSASWYLKNGSC